MRNFPRKVNWYRYTCIEYVPCIKGKTTESNVHRFWTEKLLWPKRLLNLSRNGKHSLRHNSIMYAVKKARNLPLPENIGTAMMPAYTAVPAAAPRYSTQIPSSIPARVGLLFGNPSIRLMLPRRKTTAFSCDELKSCVLDATRIWDMYSTTALHRPACATASTPLRSSSIVNPIKRR
ncbi:hypothetical protein SAMN05216387_11150 [Nitrosovibrio tenuis]|uniref:Uncharacterized protein n=1 Tax=Nitrosovibrio tenuis TaxID=1233 RepID=A0A1H7QCG4_9PROT|nr:hypothetical protein SAMN05216387_11150 [Nitrosovibrio tenuis]